MLECDTWGVYVHREGGKEATLGGICVGMWWDVVTPRVRVWEGG